MGAKVDTKQDATVQGERTSPACSTRCPDTPAMSAVQSDKEESDGERVSLPMSTDSGISRMALLRARCAFAGPSPAEISQFYAGQYNDAPDRSLFGTRRQAGPTLGQSENAYKIARGDALPRKQQLQRDVNSLLNKVCPENVSTIIQRVANVEIFSADELHLVIQLIFKKALTEPHYCETYADMVSELKQYMPEFPAADGGKPVTFKTALLNTTQNEFESLSNILKLTAEDVEGLDLEEIELLKKKRKDRVLANMKFIGQLFLRSLLSGRVIGSVMKDLAKCNQGDVVPEEPMVECLCELMTNIGYTLEAHGPAGKEAISTVCDRLLQLKQQPGTRKGGLYSKRVQFTIQDLLDVRSVGWKKKTFKASAKTKEEIRQEQVRDMQAQMMGMGQASASEVQIAGVRKGISCKF